MNHRQLQALKHPESYSDTPEAPHKNRVEKLGQRTTILTVSERMPGVWVWHASVSFGRQRLDRWSPERAQQGDNILRSLLDGVGGRIVLGIKPNYELETWKADGLEAMLSLDDGAASAYIDASLGYQMPLPPSSFAAMHMWKELTEDEIVTVKSVTKGESV